MHTIASAIAMGRRAVACEPGLTPSLRSVVLPPLRPALRAGPRVAVENKLAAGVAAEAERRRGWEGHPGGEHKTDRPDDLLPNSHPSRPFRPPYGRPISVTSPDNGPPFFPLQPLRVGRAGISRDLAYDLVARGELPSVRLGRRLVVPRLALEETLARLSEAG